jgi:hypothetical protein
VAALSPLMRDRWCANLQYGITGSRFPEASVGLRASDGKLGDKAAVIVAAATDRVKVAIRIGTMLVWMLLAKCVAAFLPKWSSAHEWVGRDK